MVSLLHVVTDVASVVVSVVVVVAAAVTVSALTVLFKE